MQFNELFIIYQAVKKYWAAGDKWKNWKVFYLDAIANKLVDKTKNINHPLSAEKMLMEYMWLKEGKPYYKIWPGIFDEFIRTRIDIKSDLVKPPHAAFAILFPKLEEPVLSFYSGETLYHARAILISRPEKWGLTENQIRIKIDVGVGDDPIPGSYYHSITLEQGRTIEECIGQIVDVKEEKDETIILNQLEMIPATIIEACIRLVIGVHFIATGAHKILEYDVLAKLLDAYRKIEDNSPEKKNIEKKSRAKGHHGWHVGRGKDDRNLKLPRGISYVDAVREAGGRELLYQHTRGGHWHTVRYGHDKTEEKVVWYDEVVVRSDLLPKPITVRKF